MKGKYQLIKIINQAVSLETRNIHFTLMLNGLIMINLRKGYKLLPYSRITPDEYKEILDYIDDYTEFKSVQLTSKKIYQKELREGIIKFNDSQNDMECHVSTLLAHRFKSLILRIEKPRIKGKDSDESFKRNLELFLPEIFASFNFKNCKTS